MRTLATVGCVLFTSAMALGCSKSSSAPPTDATSTSAKNEPPKPSGDPGAKSSSPAVSDTFQTSKGPLAVTPIHHASTLLTLAGKSIYVDPAMDGDYASLPKADFVFVSHTHPDHLDTSVLAKIKKAETVFVGPQAVADQAKDFTWTVLGNGDTKSFGDFSVEGIPMYNLTRGPSTGKLFHDKGRGDGFVFTFGDKRVYFSGDTECIPEMKALKNIDVAFVCMNLPYTMPPSEAAECIKAFSPKVLLPYHYKGSNLDELTTALKGTPTEVRERKWY